MGLFDWIGDIGQAVMQPVATKDQELGIDKARATQQAQYTKNQSYLDPYSQTGQKAFGDLYNNVNSGAYNVNVTPQNLSGDPGYQFQLQQGQQALQRSAAAHGGLMSGGFAKDLDQYSQGLASTQYQNAWNRQFQQNQFNYNSLANIGSMGMQAGNSLANLGQNYGNTMAGYDIDHANVEAAGLMGQAQLGGQAASGFANTGSQIAMSAGGMGGMGGMGGGQSIPGQAPSASGLYGQNPGNYSLGAGQLSMGGQAGGSLGYDSIPMQPVNTGYQGLGGNYSLGNYGGQLIPPQMGGSY